MYDVWCSYKICYNHTKKSASGKKKQHKLNNIFKGESSAMNNITGHHMERPISAKFYICLTSYLIKYSFNKPPPHTSLCDRALWKPSALWPACQHNSHTAFRAPQQPLGGGQLSSRAVSAQASAVRRGDKRNCTRASITAPAQEPCSIMAFT